MSRWKVWHHGISKKEPGADFKVPKVDGLNVELVAWVTPASTEVRECRTVEVIVQKDGSVWVKHTSQMAPDEADEVGLHPVVSAEYEIPGWVEREDWEITGEDEA